MINYDPNKDRAEESDEEECTQYDLANDETEDTFVGLGGDTWIGWRYMDKNTITSWRIQVLHLLTL